MTTISTQPSAATAPTPPPPRESRRGMELATMQAAVIAEPGRCVIESRPVPRPGPGQVRIRMESCGVCGSNLPVWEGREWFRYPMEAGAPGHEGCGTVDALGEGVTGLEIGERVAALTYHAFAEYDIAESAAVVRLPRTLDGAPFPGEALGCAMNVMARSGIEAGETVAVVGVGFLGALLTQLAARRGARVIAITRRPFALAAARAMGAAETIILDDPGRVTAEVRRLTGDRLCGVVVEAAGTQGTLDVSAELTRERGRLVISGYHQDGPRRVNMQMWNWRGLDVINAHERDAAVYVEGMRCAVEAVAAGRLDPAPLYTHRLPLERLSEAMETARQRPDGFMKALVTMEPASPL